MVFVLTLLGTIACSDAAKNEILVKCKIDGVADSSKVMLLKTVGQLGKPMGNEYFKNGELEFRINADSTDIFPVLFTVYGDSLIAGRLDFYVEPGTVTRITATKEDNKNVFLWKAKNKGPLQKENNEITEALEHVSRPYYEALYRRQIVNRKSSEADSIEQEYKKCEKIQLNAIIDYIRDSKSISDLKLYRLKEALLDGIKYGKELVSRKKELKTLYERLDNEQKNSSSGEEIKAMLFQQILKKGDQLPDNELEDVNGKTFKMSDFRGKTILLDFWSSGCGPCISAGPELKKVQEEFADKLQVVSISTDDEKSWKTASERYQITWTNLSDKKGRNAGFCSMFEFKGIPYFMVADENGVIVGDWTGYGEGIIRNNIQEYIPKK